MDDYEIVVSLKPGDHIYRDLIGIKRHLGHHHGIVREFPNASAIADTISQKTSKNGEKNETL